MFSSPRTRDSLSRGRKVLGYGASALMLASSFLGITATASGAGGSGQRLEAVDDNKAVITGYTLVGDVTANDSVPGRDDGNYAVYQIDDAHLGTLYLSRGGNFTFEPDPDASGTEAITYELRDPDGNIDSANLYITVRGPDEPVANDDFVEMEGEAEHDPDKQVEGNVLDNDADPDGDPIMVVTERTGWIDPPTAEHGELTIHPDGRFTYSPERGFTGVEEITYTIKGWGESQGKPGEVTAYYDWAVLTIQVNAPSDIVDPGPDAWRACVQDASCLEGGLERAPCEREAEFFGDEATDCDSIPGPDGGEQDSPDVDEKDLDDSCPDRADCTDPDSDPGPETETETDPGDSSEIEEARPAQPRNENPTYTG